MKARSRSSSIPIKRSRGSRDRRVSGSPQKNWTCEAVLRELRSLGEVRNVEGMARFGIVATNVYGVSKPKMDILARQIGRNRRLALELWDSGVHDARILAGMIDDASQVPAAQMDKWVRHFDNWDVCDGTCCHLFVFCEPAWQKAIEWSGRNEEFVKRAGFALMAYLAYRDKTATDAKFLKLLPIIEKHSYDDRNFVRKAVNWALRNIGKRNLRLNRAAIRAAERIRRQDSRAARWIAADALRELNSDAVQARLRRKAR
jgi:3-methyladenine DNA glycosylase AlkD